MKQFVAIITLCLLFSSFTIGCERASLIELVKMYITCRSKAKEIPKK